LTVLLAFGLAQLLAALALPHFNALIGQPLRLRYEGNTLLLLAGLLVATVLVAGAYPAFFLSSFRPVQVLKGTPRFGPLAARLRWGLVVFQFAVSSVLIAGTLVVYLQTRYISRKHLGFNREHVVYSWLEGDLPKHYGAFKNELLASPAIRSVTNAGQAPLHVSHTVTSVKWPGKGANQKIAFSHWGVGYGFVQTLGLQLKEGRDFSPAFPTDTLNVLINEEAARVMGLAHPVDQPIIVQRSILAKGKIIGVVKNFHLVSLHTPIQPLLIFLNLDPDWGYAIVKTTPGRTAEALAALRKAHGRYNPAFPPQFEYADQEYAKLYQDETTMGRLAGCFAGMAIFISCLGMLGLAAFTAEQRTKEIGIRKVLGANVSGIVVLLSRDFLKPVGWAIVLATPVAWYLVRGWLQDFAYKIDLGCWPFAVAGGLSVVIALLTVGYQSVKAAAANPVASLRSE
ncbi:MAG: ABC transporter permease, partial [Cytophagales bacterium]|nr:ABC transporter permease [Cytophagales bacterium]